MKLTLYIQRACSKSVEAERLLKSEDLEVEVIDLAQNPPTAEKLIELAKKAEEPLSSFLRSDAEKILGFEMEKNLYSEQELAEAMSKNPKAIQRPIIENENSAMIARPPEKVLEFIGL